MKPNIYVVRENIRYIYLKYFGAIIVDCDSGRYVYT